MTQPSSKAQSGQNEWVIINDDTRTHSTSYRIDSSQTPSDSRLSTSGCVSNASRYTSYAGLTTSFLSGLTWGTSGIGLLCCKVASLSPGALLYVFAFSSLAVVGGGAAHALSRTWGDGNTQKFVKEWKAGMDLGYWALPLTLIYGYKEACPTDSNRRDSSVNA